MIDSVVLSINTASFTPVNRTTRFILDYTVEVFGEEIAVAEPAALLIFGAGLIGLVGMRRKMVTDQV